MRRNDRSAMYLIALFSCGTALLSGQQPKGQGAPAQVIDCSKPQPLAGTKSFVDELGGFRFEYPDFLELNETLLYFDNPPCGVPFDFGGDIQVQVSLPERYREPFYGDSENVSIGTKTLNGLMWEHYRTKGSARLCTFSNGEQVCLFAADTSPKHELPEAAVAAMKTIEASFAFTDLARRMDAKIASLRAGDKVGALTVGRVVTREMAHRHPAEYRVGRYEAFGEVDFTGTLVLTGSIDDIGTMNSRGQFRITLDSDDGPQLPFDLDDQLGPGIEFTCARSVEKEIEAAAYSNGELRMTVKDVRTMIGPPGGHSEVEVELVGVEKTR